MLVDGRDGEEAEQHRNHEHIVGAQRLLNDVPGEILRRSRSAIINPAVDCVDRQAQPTPVVLVGEVSEEREKHRQRDPHCRPPQGLFDADHMRLAVEHAQVDGKQCQHEQNEPDPYPEHFLPTPSHRPMVRQTASPYRVEIHAAFYNRCQIVLACVTILSGGSSGMADPSRSNSAGKAASSISARMYCHARAGRGVFPLRAYHSRTAAVKYMSRRPIIGITKDAGARPGPTESHFDHYASSVEKAGGTALPIYYSDDVSGVGATPRSARCDSLFGWQ